MQIYVGVSKQELMIGIGVCIQDWHTSYKRHGLAGLLNHNKKDIEAVESLKKLQPKKYKK